MRQLDIETEPEFDINDVNLSEDLRTMDMWPDNDELIIFSVEAPDIDGFEKIITILPAHFYFDAVFVQTNGDILLGDDIETSQHCDTVGWYAGDESFTIFDAPLDNCRCEPIAAEAKLTLLRKVTESDTQYFEDNNVYDY